jgi:DNA-binding transcriptional LysR family regulator
MQVKKVEELVGRPIFVRDSRKVTPTLDGEFLISHARRVLALNREAMAHFVTPDLRGLVRVGAPDDIAERFLPDMLRRFSESHPAVTVNVVVDGSMRVRERQRQGLLDVTLINCEDDLRDLPNSELVFRERLIWAVRAGGCAAEQDPLPVAVWEEDCLWRKAATEGLDKAGRAWRVAFQSAHITGQRAAILADLAVAPIPASCVDDKVVLADARLGLPDLPEYGVAMILPERRDGPIAAFADHVRASFVQRARAGYGASAEGSAASSASPSNSVSTMRAS